MKRKKFRLCIILLLIGITALVHFNCLLLGFNLFWDRIFILDNPYIGFISLKLIGRTFTSFLEADYCPLNHLSFSLDYTFWSYNAFGWHLTSYLAYIFNVVLLFLIICQLSHKAGDRFYTRMLLAGLTALLYSIHPLQVESIAWVQCRCHLMCASFFLLSILLYLKWDRSQSQKYYCLSILCALCAGLFKASAFSLPLVLIILDYYPLRNIKKRTWKKKIIEKIPYIIVAGLIAELIIVIRHQVNYLHPMTLPSLIHNLIEFPAVITFYLSKTILPWHLAPIYPLDLTSDLMMIIFSWLFTVGFVVFAVINISRRPAILTGILLFIILLLPGGGLVRSGATVLGDRYVLLADILLFFGLAWIIIKALHSFSLRWPVATLTIIWAGFLVWKTVTYTALWDNAIALTHQAYDLYPQSKIIEHFMVGAYNNTALEAAAQGDLNQAEKYLKQALTIRPEAATYKNFAYLSIKQDRLDEAIKYYQKALELKPALDDLVTIHYSMSRIYLRKGETEKADLEFRKASMFRDIIIRANR